MLLSNFHGIDDRCAGPCPGMLQIEAWCNCSAARHADASGSAPDRTLTAIIYLNDRWDASAHGGQLCVYNVSESEASVAALHAHHCTGKHFIYCAGLQLLWRHWRHMQCSLAVAAAGRKPVSSVLSHISSGEGPGYLLGEPATVIAPLGGRLVVFDSRLHHEVLASHKPRLVHAPVLSITPHLNICCWG